MKSSTVFRLFFWVFFLAACIWLWIIIYYKNWIGWAILALCIGGLIVAYILKCESKKLGI